VALLHGVHTLHGDLKLENILVNQAEGPRPQGTVNDQGSMTVQPEGQDKVYIRCVCQG
jgi:hypothetical protein